MDEVENEGGEQEPARYSHDALAFRFLYDFPHEAAKWVGVETDVPYDVRRVVYKLPVVEREADCVFFPPEGAEKPSIFWEIYNHRNDLAIRNLLGKAGVISEERADRIYSALSVLLVMRESQIPRDPGFLEAGGYELRVHERMLREKPDDPFLRLLGLTYSPPNYPGDVAEALEILAAVRMSRSEPEAEKVVNFVVTIFLNKYRNMDQSVIMQDLGQIKGLVNPMDVPWARSFFEEGLDKGIEKGIVQGKEEERRAVIRALSKRGIPADEIADILGKTTDFVRRVLADENGA